ncbi:MAG: hypothetical protein Q9205_000194 [Flavoplaca limonia]
MRLRLTVQRHGLPPARVLWTLAAVRPPYSAAGPEPTVAQLLEQVNEIIPLESEDWGLEDYAVEVEGFECLHFSETSKVLKEDDEVCIRPLSTSDLRCRRISGRDQISSDGRHLTDGVAFGRPLLRRPTRPAIHIPPRKRRRLTYDEDHEDEEEEDLEANSQFVVRSGVGDDSSSLSRSDGSEGSVEASDGDEDLHDELNDIRHDLSRSPSPAGGAKAQPLHTISKCRPRKAQGLGITAPSLLVDEHGEPYPETYYNPLLDMFADDDSVGRAASPEHIRSSGPDPASKHYRRYRPAVASRTSSTGSGDTSGVNVRRVRTQSPGTDTPATAGLESSDDSEDDDFEPSDNITMWEDESNKENATPDSQADTDVDEAAELVAKIDSSFSSGSDSDSDETSSSGSSSSGSPSVDSEGEHAPSTKIEYASTKIEYASRDEETSSSGSSSSDNTSSGSEDEQPPKPSITPHQALNALNRKEKISSETSDGHDGLQRLREPVPPGAGRKGTQKRNQRRRDHKKLLRLQRSGELASNATVADLRALEELRRQNLLQAISFGGVDVEDDLALNQVSTAVGSRSATSPGSSAVERSYDVSADTEKSASGSFEKTLVDASASEPSTTLATVSSGDRNKQPTVPEVQASPEDWQHLTRATLSPLINEDTTVAAKPRMRLDIDSSRRLLFGALGHRTPKSKEDEAKLQEKIRKDAHTPRKPPPQTAQDDNELGANNLAQPDEIVRWQDRIELSAVECCHDGIELSTPPFPFVQRWDPQQQRGYGAGQTASLQKSKKRKRNNRKYEESFEPLGDNPAPYAEPPASTEREAQLDGDAKDGNDVIVSNDEITGNDNLYAANDQLSRETEESSGDVHGKPDPSEDLPPIPEDLDACPDLKKAAACSPGMVIAFKQLDMSVKTNWQPIRSEYRTALINNVFDDGTLSLTMALRDQSHREEAYDPDTGERLYTKFEMPGYDESEYGYNHGVLELAFLELIDPKLIQAPTKTDCLDIHGSSLSALPTGLGDVEESVQQATIDNLSLAASENVAQQVSKDLRDPQEDVEATEQVRREIQDLIKDAGWRSSIQSNESAQHGVQEDAFVDQDHAMDFEMNETHQDFETPRSTPFQGPLSPRFDGFSSSPLAEPHQVEDQVKYPILREASSERSNEATDDPDRTMADTSSQADLEAMKAIREDFEKDLNRPATPKDVDAQADSFDLFGSPVTTSLAVPRDKGTSPPANTDLYRNTIPDSQPPPSNPTTTFVSSLQHNHKQQFNTSSDNDDLPDLSTVFSSFNSQRASSINNNNTVKSEHHSSSSDEAFISTLPSHKPNKKSTKNDKPPSSSAPARTSNIHTAKSSRSTSHTSNNKAKPKSTKPTTTLPRSNKYEAAPRSSQDWIGTQVVDLTLSIDPIDFSMEENIIPSQKIKDESDIDC